jgi:hypothetical protein
MVTVFTEKSATTDFGLSQTWFFRENPAEKT